MGTVRTATVRGARRSPCKVSRVFSRRPGRRFPLFTVRLGFVGSCGPSLGNERDAGTASRSREVRPPRKKALDPCDLPKGAKRQPPAAHRSRRDARQSYRPRQWALVPLQANAQLQLPVSAFLAALLLLILPAECLLELPCSGHASCSPRLRAWQPGTSRLWRPRPSSKGASEAAEGCPNRCVGCRLIINF